MIKFSRYCTALRGIINVEDVRISLTGATHPRTCLCTVPRVMIVMIIPTCPPNTTTSMWDVCKSEWLDIMRLVWLRSSFVNWGHISWVTKLHKIKGRFVHRKFVWIIHHHHHAAAAYDDDDNDDVKDDDNDDDNTSWARAGADLLMMTLGGCCWWKWWRWW